MKRVLWVLRLGQTHPPLEPPSSPSSRIPKISVIVPARDEERNIPHCLYHLFKQDYANYELIVVDDRSEDKTPHLLENFKKLSPVPLKIVRVEKLPPGWTGKNYAMFTGSKAAAGEWFLFTDADTTHRPESIQTAVSAALEDRIDFLTLAPQIECRSFWENVVQPLAVTSLALWFNPSQVNDDRSPTVLANGQFILVKKEVYEKLNGNESIKNEVIEDVMLAKKAKGAGYRVRFLNGTKLYSTRMYTSLQEIRTGWTRILTFLFDKKIPALLHKIFLFAFFSSFPFLVLSWEVFLRLASPLHFSSAVFWLSLGVCSWIVVVRSFGNRFVKTNPWYAFLHLLGSLVMIWILLACIGRVLFQRPSVWRGQSYQ